MSLIHKKVVRTVLSGNSLKVSLIRGGLGSIGIQAANRMLALALGVVLARMLGPDGYGVYAYAFAIMSLLMVVAEAGVPTLLMREIASSQGRQQWALLRGALRRGAQFVALAATTVSLLGLLVLWWFADSLRPEALYTTALMLLVLPVSALCKTVSHAMQGLHRVVVGQAVDLLIRPLLVLIISSVVFMAWPEQRQPDIAMAAQLIGALMVLLIGALVLRHFLPDESHAAAPEYKSRQWLKSALPFTLIGGAGIINNQADIIMLGWFMDSEDVGIYRVAVQGGMTILFILHAINAVVAPVFARLFSEQDIDRLSIIYRKSANFACFSTLPLLLLIVFWGDFILSFVFGSGYEEGYYSLVLLSFGQFILVSIGSSGTLLQMSNKEGIAATALYLSAVANVLSNLVLIPSFGAEGAALASLLSNALMSLFLIYAVQRHVGVYRFPVDRGVNG